MNAGEKISLLESVFNITLDICIKVPDEGGIHLVALLFFFVTTPPSHKVLISVQEKACPDLLVLEISQGS